MQPSPQEFGTWVLVLVALLGAASSVSAVVATFRTQRRQVRMEESFATLPQLEKVERNLNGRMDLVDSDIKTLKESIVANGEVRRQRIEGKVEDVRREMKADINELHEKVNGVSVQVAALGKNSELNNAQMMQISAQLNRMIERKG